MTKEKQIHSNQDSLNLTEEDIRWGTPEAVANYRAKRLSCNTIVDLCCASGFQSFAFAKTCKKVIAIDLDPQKIARAKENAKTLNIKNIEFHVGDVLEPHIIKLAIGADIIFCDPERLESEPKRTIDTIIPNIKELLEEYQKITQNIAIELPPLLEQDEINTLRPNFKNLKPQSFEKEYITYQGRTNRLTLYFGSLQHTTTKVVALPSTEELSPNNKKLATTNPPQATNQNTVPSQPTLTQQNSKTTLEVETFLCEIDPTLERANLLSEFQQKVGGTIIAQKKNIYLHAISPIYSPFITNIYRILNISEFKIGEIVKALKLLDAKQVTLRFHVSPQKYWNERSRLEKQLSGEKSLQLFKIGTQAIITEKIENIKQ